jgi:serine/threonine protein kinase
MVDEPKSPRPADSSAPEPTVDLPGPEQTQHEATQLDESGRMAQLAPADSEVAGRLVGEFELLEEIGRGNMGVVYRARERHSGRLVALKMMLDRPGGEGGNRRRFALEARATGQLSHPGIVTIHAWGEYDGHPYYTMDYVPGTLLSRVLEDGPLPCSRAVHYLVALARAVAAAHHLGIVHRDLKPGNVIIDGNDRPCVLDFGLAKRLSTTPGAAPNLTLDSIAGAMPSALAEASPAKPGSSEDRGTEQGAVLGTPTYMAPEQATGDHHKVGPATDVHALGAIFYEMLTGRPPFQAATITEILNKVATREPRPLRSWGLRIPPAVEDVCVRALRKDPHDRHANAGALADDLEYRWQHCLQGPRFARLTGLATLALILLAGGWLAIHLAGMGWSFGFGGTEPTAVAAVLLEVVIFFGGGLLALGAALVWLGAWSVHSDRPAYIAITLATLTAVAWSAWLLAPGGLASALGLAIALALSAAAAVALAGWYYRRSAERAHKNDPAGPASKSFMQRLMNASAQARRALEAREDRVARMTGADHVALADFELARVLHDWKGGHVQRGRQKSLNRPVLIWTDTFEATGESAQQGVLVRHPDLLRLYAVGTGPEGRFLVTEPSAGTPLADYLQRSPVTPLQAVGLVSRLARVIESYHEQGAFHGRLTSGWILMRGELEPVLCPCGALCRSAEDRGDDIRALGKLLLKLLSVRTGRGARRVRPIGKAAALGTYVRAADLAADLDRAALGLRYRWRSHLILAVLVAVATFPWFLLAILGGTFVPAFRAALAPSCMLLGYYQLRTVAARYRLHDRLVRPRDVATGLGPLLLLTLPAGLLAAFGLPVFPADAYASVLTIADLLGCWLAGACLGALVTGGEAVYATLAWGRTLAASVRK